MSQINKNSGGGGGGITFPITVPQGGTGQTTFPAHTVLLGEGTSNIGNAGPGAVNSILFGQGAGADPIFGTLVAGANITLTNGAGTITISATNQTANSITFTDDAGTTATTVAGAINLFGTAAQGISVLGNGVSTITVSAANATTAQKGVVQLADSPTTIAGSDTTEAVTSAGIAAKLGTQTAHGVLLGEGTTSPLGVTAVGATNTVLLGNTGADPSFGTVPNAALTNSSVTLNSGNNITVTGGGPLALGGTASFNVTGTNNHAVQIGNASGSLTSIAVGSNGEVLLGATGADPVFGTITSPDNSIQIGLGAGTLTLKANPGIVNETLTGNTGPAVVPTAGNINVIGDGALASGLTFSGTGSTLTGTVQTASTTQMGVTQLATTTQTTNGSLESVANTPAGLAAKLGTQTVHAIAIGNGTTNAINWLADGTTGQVLLAQTGADPMWGVVPPSPLTITGDTGGALSPTANNWNIIGQQAGTIPVMDTIGAVSTLSIEDRTWMSQFVVDPSATVGLRGTFSTITTALAAASTGQQVIVRNGTYTENFTVPSGVTVTAAPGADVIIIGEITVTAGNVGVDNCTLQTNSNFIANVSGGALFLTNCVLFVTNNTGLNLTGSGEILLNNCTGNISNTGIAFFTSSSSNPIQMTNTNIANSGLSTTQSTSSGSGGIALNYSYINFPLSVSSSSDLAAQYSSIDCENLSVTALTTAGTGTSPSFFSEFNAGSQPAISVGSGTTVILNDCRVSSSNTNAITGAGSIQSNMIDFSNTSHTINTTTQTGGTIKGGTSQNPSAGFLGEQISSAVTSVSLSNGTPKSITSINIIPGIWDISICGHTLGSGGVTTFMQIGISTTTNTFQGNQGDQTIKMSSAATSDLSLSLPVFRQVVTATTTYFFIAQTNFATGTCTADGRISAIRVG